MRKSILLCVIVSALFALAGCATTLPDFPGVEGITNFDRVNDGLYRGAQPNSLGLQSLARLGIKTIINLRQTNEVWAVEAAEAQALGITYTNVPMSGVDRPTDQQVEQVLALLETAPAPVFIHCLRGADRTGTIIACYRIQHDQWTSAQAMSEADQHGMSVWEVGMKNFVKDFAKAHGSN